MYQKRDQNCLWHPFTQHGMDNSFPAFVKGEGPFLFDESGKKWVDLISSWQVNIHGHCEPTIMEAIRNQTQLLDQSMFGGYTNDKAVELAENLLDLVKPNFDRVFLSDNGSTSIEIALKVAFKYYVNNSKIRTKWISFHKGYHGGTVGSMSLSQCNDFFQEYKQLCFNSFVIPYPEYYDDTSDEEWKESSENSLNTLKDILFMNGNDIIALIVEPILQGAGGMRVTRPEFLNEVFKLCKSYEILIIADEVLTGFGRTGKLFGFQYLDIAPDILCLHKGITGGTLPLAATLFPKWIFEAFISDKNTKNAFLHGHTYSGNSISCAAGIANIKLIKLPQTMQNIQRINDQHQKFIKCLKQQLSEKVYNTFSLGPLCAFSIKVNDLDTLEYGSEFSLKLRKAFNKHFLLLRLLRNRIYILPPYGISEPLLEECYEKIIQILKEILVFKNNI